MDKLVLRKINIMNWDTPVVDQFGIEAVPHFIIYDPQGKVFKTGTSEVAKFIVQWKK